MQSVAPPMASTNSVLVGSVRPGGNKASAAGRAYQLRRRGFVSSSPVCSSASPAAVPRPVEWHTVQMFNI